MSIKPFGELKEGDYITGSDGLPVRVVAAYEEHIPASMYRLTFDNGKTLEASGNHLVYVVSSVDRSLHSSRLKAGQEALRNLSNKSKLQLLELALSFDEPVEGSLADMLQLVEGQGDPVLTPVLVRVAESLGPIAEEATTYQDMATGESAPEEVLRKYDARLFAQQLLSLRDARYRRRWPLILGRVVTVENLLLMEENLEIPELANSAGRSWLQRIRNHT